MSDPVNIDQVKQDAFYLGLEYGPMGTIEDVRHFQEGAEYVNNVLPELYRIAGAEGPEGEITCTADDLNGTVEVGRTELLVHAVDGWIDGAMHGAEDPEGCEQLAPPSLRPDCPRE